MSAAALSIAIVNELHQSSSFQDVTRISICPGPTNVLDSVNWRIDAIERSAGSLYDRLLIDRLRVLRAKYGRQYDI